MSEVIPLADRVVLEILENEVLSPGGLIHVVHTSQSREVTQRAKVLAVGAGALLANGTRTPPEVKVGDIVLFDKTAGIEIKWDSKTVRLIGERNLLAILVNDSINYTVKTPEELMKDNPEYISFDQKYGKVDASD